MILENTADMVPACDVEPGDYVQYDEIWGRVTDTVDMGVDTILYIEDNGLYGEVVPLALPSEAAVTILG